MNSGRNTFLVLWFFFYSGARYSAYLLTYNTQLLTCICVLLLKNGHGLVLVFGSDFGVKNLSQKARYHRVYLLNCENFALFSVADLRRNISSRYSYSSIKAHFHRPDALHVAQSTVLNTTQYETFAQKQTAKTFPFCKSFPP